MPIRISFTWLELAVLLSSACVVGSHLVSLASTGNVLFALAPAWGFGLSCYLVATAWQRQQVINATLDEAVVMASEMIADDDRMQRSAALAVVNATKAP